VFQGSARRKKKVIHRTNTTDDKKLQVSLKKLGLTTIPGIEEVDDPMVSLVIIRTLNKGQIFRVNKNNQIWCADTQLFSALHFDTNNTS